MSAYCNEKLKRVIAGKQAAGRYIVCFFCNNGEGLELINRTECPIRVHVSEDISCSEKVQNRGKIKGQRSFFGLTWLKA